MEKARRFKVACSNRVLKVQPWECGLVKALLSQLAGYFVCICREGNDTKKRILIR